MKIKKYFIFGICTLASITITANANTDHIKAYDAYSNNEIINLIVKNSYGLPEYIGNGVTMTKITASNSTLITHNSLDIKKLNQELGVNYKQSDIKKEGVKAWKATAVKGDCQNPKRIYFLNRGINFKYIWNFSDGSKFIEFTIRKNDCK